MVYRAHRLPYNKMGRSEVGIRYLYRGVFIECGGYFQPDHSVIWYGIDEDGTCAFAHCFDLYSCKKFIDDDLADLEKKGHKFAYDDEAFAKMDRLFKQLGGTIDLKEFYNKYKDK